MSDELLIHPERIDAKPQLYTGRFAPAELDRLQDALANGEGELRYRISASLDPQRRKVLSCIIEGFVFLTCRTSMDAFRHEISVQDRLVLVERESELPAIEEESEDEDYVVADGPLDIRDLVEDAVLLALPMMPRKPGLEAPRDGADKPAEWKQSPFAALASLRKRDNDKQ